MNDWLWFFPLAGGLWYWWDALRTREIARAAGRRACDHRQVQFLDDTVVRIRIRLRRSARGHIQLERRYDFEFASDGERRYHGQIDIYGSRVNRIDMEAYRFPAGDDGEAGGKTDNVTRIH